MGQAALREYLRWKDSNEKRRGPKPNLRFRKSQARVARPQPQLQRQPDGVPNDTIGQLRGRVAALEAQIASMTATLCSEADYVVPGLTVIHALMLGLLLRRGLVAYEAVHQFLYGLDPQGGPQLKTLQVHIHNLRRRLPEGIEIKTIWGQGFELTDASRKRLREMRAARELMEWRGET